MGVLTGIMLLYSEHRYLVLLVVSVVVGASHVLHVVCSFLGQFLLVLVNDLPADFEFGTLFTVQ